MWPIIVGAGIIALIAEAFSDENKKSKTKGKKRKATSNSNQKKIFISFAIEDKRYRDFLVAQAKNAKSPFSFVDMSVKEPWVQNVWKKRCRVLISECDGMIVLLSKRTWHSGGSRWEIACAYEEGVPVVGMHVKKDNKGAIPPELDEIDVIEWTWDDIHQTIKKF